MPSQTVADETILPPLAPPEVDGLEQVSVKRVSLGLLARALAPDRVEHLRAVAERAVPLLDGRVVWNINSTAKGGGVAEMLQTLLAYGRGAGVDTRWLVLHGEEEFFAITKRLHNRLHGAAGDGGPLGQHEHERVRQGPAGQPGVDETGHPSAGHRAAARPANRRPGRRVARARRDRHLAVPHRLRRAEPVVRARLGIPQDVRGTRRRVHLLAGSLCAAVGSPGLAVGDPAVHRSVLGQEPGHGTRGGARRAGADRDHHRGRRRRSAALRASRRAATARSGSTAI